MAEKETINKLKDLIEPVPEEISKFDKESKAQLGYDFGRDERARDCQHADLHAKLCFEEY